MGKRKGGFFGSLRTAAGSGVEKYGRASKAAIRAPGRFGEYRQRKREQYQIKKQARTFRIKSEARKLSRVKA